MYELTRFNQAVLDRIQNQEPVRLTKQLDNGNLAILQIVNPDDVPAFTKFLRKRKSKLARLLASLEAAIRVGTIVFKNSMRKEVK